MSPEKFDIIFRVDDLPDGSYTAKAVIDQFNTIITEGDTVEKLIENVKDATRCHIDENFLPTTIYMQIPVFVDSAVKERE